MHFTVPGRLCCLALQWHGTAYLLISASKVNQTFFWPYFNGLSLRYCFFTCLGLQVLVSASFVEDHSTVKNSRRKPVLFSTTFFRINDSSKDSVAKDQSASNKMYQLRCWKSLPLNHGSFTPDQRECRERWALLTSRMPKPALSYTGISGSSFLLDITESSSLPTVFTFGFVKRRVRGNPAIIIYTRLLRRKIHHIQWNNIN